MARFALPRLPLRTINALTMIDSYLRAAAKSPLYLYRYTISPIMGPHCRHFPTCSQYALDAIELNGVWIGSWLALGRIARCHPCGTSGYCPATDLSHSSTPLCDP